MTRHMSHSANTEVQYYQAIVGDRHAMEAYGTMTALREGDSGGTEMNSMRSGDDMAGTSPRVQTGTSCLQKVDCTQTRRLSWSKIFCKGDG